MEFIQYFGGNACSCKVARRVTKKKSFISWLIGGAGIP